MTKGPVLLDVEEAAEVTPSTAPAIIDDGPPPGAAMRQVTQFAARPVSRLARWFWGLLVAFVGFAVSVSAWNFVTGLLTANPVLGLIASALGFALGVVALMIVVKELSAFARLSRMDRLQSRAGDTLEAKDLNGAKAVVADLLGLYRGRKDLARGADRLRERQGELLDADAMLAEAEHLLIAPLDAQAAREVEAAARQVATVTAIVPLALADVVAALTANLRMIRRVAEIYGGRSGTLGNWRLTRSVMAHLVATGAVAVGDDLIGSVAGGGVLSKVSRRFGEGVVNGALTARVGVAAIEVCRPLPYVATEPPSVTGLVRRALTGLFGA